MKTLTVSKTFTSVEELINAPEYNAIFEGFVNEHKRHFNRIQFIAAYMVATKPENNYGKSFDIYEYFVIQGLHRLMKISLGSSLDNGPMHPVDIVGPITGPDGIEIHTEKNWEKCEHNRAIARRNRTIIY